MAPFNSSIASQTTRFCAALFVAVSATFVTSLANAGCVRDYRNISFNDGSARVRSYRCATDNASLHVEFYRLSEVAIGSVLLGKPLECVRKCIGDSTILNNSVYRELRLLYWRFGNKSFRRGSDNGFSTQIKIEVPRGGLGFSAGSGSQKDGWYIWDITQGTGFAIPNTVPIARNGTGRRYMTGAELESISAHMRGACTSTSSVYCNTYPLMLSYMAGDGNYPRDLAILDDEPSDGMGCSGGVSMATRPLITTVAVLVNDSYEDVLVDSILGQEIRPNSGNRFRRGLFQHSSHIASLPIAGPLRIPGSGRAMLVLALSLGTREFNSSPTQLNEYTYGPEAAISGFQVGGARVTLDEGSANYLEVTAAATGLSCPILYVFDDTEKVWLSHGKIIHEANGISHKMTQTIPLSGFSKKFRLVEGEPERSFIDQVRLHLQLNDGSRLDLTPNNAELKEKDADYAEIPPFEGIEITFDVPGWINSRNVKSASLSVTGYYERLALGPSLSSSLVSRP